MKNDNFIVEFSRTIDQCHGQRPDDLWFSTWMSSKSPYFNYPQNFEKFWTTGYLPPRSTSGNKLKLALRLTLTLCSLLAKSFYLKIKLRKELKKLRKLSGQQINLVRTFLYKTDPAAKDPFWGDLIDRLIQDSRPLVTIYDPNFSISRCKNVYNTKRHNLPFLAFISPFKLIKNYFSLLKEAFGVVRFMGDFIVNQVNIEGLLVDSYQTELLKPSSLMNLVYLDTFQSVFEKFTLHKAYLPFENNPWEKMFYLARGNSQKKFEAIGFQHTSIQEGATNYLLSAYESQNHLIPDKIFSVGEYTYQLMKNLPHYKNIPIQVGCALRHAYLETIHESALGKNSEAINLLVILDGTLDTVKLIELVTGFIELNKLTNISIIMREHPNLLLKNFFSEFLKDEHVRSGKIIVSTQSLQQDIEWATIVLYTGSTSCIEALKMGKAVINYNFSKFNYDPLSQFSALKWEAATPHDLHEIIKHFLKLTPTDLLQKKLAAQKFVNSYFSPCTRENIERFL